MANNVYSIVNLHSGNEEVHTWFKELVENLRYPEDERPQEYEHYKPLHTTFWPDEEDTDTRGWYIDNIGVKWCHIQDAYETEINTCSAWGIPHDFYEKLSEEASKIDPNAVFTVTYEDEMPNFFGSSVYYQGEQFDSCEWDSDEYEGQGLCFYWDEDEMGEEEPEDWEASWEDMHLLQHENLQQMLDGLIIDEN